MVPLLHLCYGAHPAAKCSELGKFLLDGLQTFMPLAVSDFSISVVAVLTPIPFVHLPNLSDLCTETPDFVAQHLEVIHATRIAYLDFLSVGRQSVRFWAVCAVWRL